LAVIGNEGKGEALPPSDAVKDDALASSYVAPSSESVIAEMTSADFKGFSSRLNSKLGAYAFDVIFV